MSLKNLVLMLPLLYLGCDSNDQRSYPNTTSTISTKELFENQEPSGPFEGPGYQIDLVQVNYNQNFSSDEERRFKNASSVKDCLQKWATEHKEYRIISVISTPSVTTQTWITHLIITSYKTGKLPEKNKNDEALK